MIPFSPPYIDEENIKAVSDVLRSGWLTTGPVTKQFEEKIKEYCKCNEALCLNSATAGLELALSWFGVKKGDEVILPAYTYAATANVIVHCGATPVFVDINKDDFNISIASIESAISARTKVIIPVDIAGNPCDYDEILALAIKHQRVFKASTDIQRKLGRLLILSDSAHSFGARYKNKVSGSLADISIFSFHVVKNLSTGEGGAINLNLPDNFDNLKVKNELKIKANHGQSNNAFDKENKHTWRYDIIEAGYKFNMSDITAALGLVEIKRYNNLILARRKKIFAQYDAKLKDYDWAVTPISKTEIKTSSFHLYLLRIKGINELQRDEIIDEITRNEVAVNVHFIPLPMMTFYKNMGYSIDEYPSAYENYSQEISLPVFIDLTDKMIDTIINTLVQATEKVLDTKQLP